MNVRRRFTLLAAVAVVAPLAGALAQPVRDNPFGADPAHGPDGLEDRSGYGGATYGGATYGGAAYGGATDGEAPAVLVQTWTAVDRFDDAGRHPLHALPMNGPTLVHDYQPLLVDEASGRWFLARQRRSEGGAAAPAWTIVMGDRDRVLAERAGDPSCTGRPTCFEQPLGLTARGAALMTLSLSMRGTTLGSYADATGPRRALAGRSIATRFALAPKQDRAAYASRGGVTLIDWAGAGPSRKPRPVRVKVTGDLENLALTDTTLFFRRERAPGAMTIEAIDLATLRRTEVYRPAAALVSWTPLAAPGRGAVFVHDCRPSTERNPCDLIELSARGARVAVRGIAIAFDVSADGRYVVVRRSPADRRGRTTAWDDVVIADLATGADVRVLPELDVTTAQFTR